MKIFWRVFWLAAVVFGGLSLLKIVLAVFKLGNRKYIEI